MNARVAIITRTRDRLPLLKRAVESVLGQSLRDWQHVIVNDGGDAEALEAFLEPYRERYGNRLLVVHHAASQGMQPAANAGIEASSSEFLAIHDDDDAWHTDFLQDTVGFLDHQGADSRYRGVVVQTERVWETVEDSGTATETRREPYLPLKEVNLFRVGYENPFPPIAFLYRRSVWEELGAYRPEFDVAGDLDFNLRFLLHYEIGVLPEVRAYYHWRESSSGEWANSVTAGQKHHARKLNEVKNHYLRSGRTPAEGALGLALEMAQYLVLQQWETRQIIDRLDGLNTSTILQELHDKTEDLRHLIQHEDHGAIDRLQSNLLQDLHAKAEDLRHVIRHEDSDAVDRAKSFLAKEISDKAEAASYHQSVQLQQLKELLEEQRQQHHQELLRELYEKTEDLRHVVRHEDHEAIIRVRDFLAKEIADKSADGNWHHENGIARIEALLKAMMGDHEQLLVKELYDKTEELRALVSNGESQALAHLREHLAQEISTKSEAGVFSFGEQIRIATEEIQTQLSDQQQRLLKELFHKTEDLRHQILHEDHDAVQRAVDALRGEVSDKAEATTYHTRVEIEKLAQEQRERLDALTARTVLFRLGPLEISWQKKRRS